MRHLKAAFFVGSFAIALSTFAQMDKGPTGSSAVGTSRDPSSSIANDQHIKRTGPSTGNDDALYTPSAKKINNQKDGSPSSNNPSDNHSTSN